MVSQSPTPVQLSVIVPVLNEAVSLPGFVTTLRQQRQVNYELIIVDGGSTDGSVELLEQDNQIRLVRSPRGRGRQLNAGIALARGDWLLFLHADSRYSDPLAWRKGIDFLANRSAIRVAGHFAMSFQTDGMKKSKGYDFYERKARSSRPETIHGDQGFLLHRTLLQQVGRFREDLPVMEDTDFAERLRTVGQWQLLPAEIQTSARRFEAEGLWQRQFLGALMMCFRSIGWTAFFDRAPGLYRDQAQTQTLRLTPFLDLIDELLGVLPWREQWRLWRASGAYVRRHGWQLFFAADCHRARHQGRSTAETPDFWQLWGEPVYELLTDHPVGRYLYALSLRLWFAIVRIWLRKKETGQFFIQRSEH